MAEEESGTAPGSGDTHGGRVGPPSTDAEAFAAGRSARDGSGDGSSGDAGPDERPTVRHPEASSRSSPFSPSSDSSRTEVLGTSGGRADAPTAVQPTPPSPPRAGPGPTRSGPSAVGVMLRKALGLVATVVTVVGLLCAAVLVVFVVLRIVGVNPANGVAQAVGAAADRLVGAFRDLFLIPDPVVGLVVDYGLAAVAWVVGSVIVARGLRAVGRAVP